MHVPTVIMQQRRVQTAQVGFTQLPMTILVRIIIIVQDQVDFSLIAVTVGRVPRAAIRVIAVTTKDARRTVQPRDNTGTVDHAKIVA